jgi:hypothetical protein
MVVDRSHSPFALHLTPESFDLLPGEPEAGGEWVLSVWTAGKDGKPYKALERICHWRRVDKLGASSRGGRHESWLRPC